MPLILYGEGNYAITDVQEIDTTEAYLKLGEEIISCQNLETFLECQTKDYIKIGLENCNCTTFELRDFSKNVNQINASIISNII